MDVEKRKKKLCEAWEEGDKGHRVRCPRVDYLNRTGLDSLAVDSVTMPRRPDVMVCEEHLVRLENFQMCFCLVFPEKFRLPFLKVCSQGHCVQKECIEKYGLNKCPYCCEEPSPMDNLSQPETDPVPSGRSTPLGGSLLRAITMTLTRFCLLS